MTFRRKSLLFSVGKACHQKWYHSLFNQADLNYDTTDLSGTNNVVAVALYSKKKAMSCASFTVSSTIMEDVLGLESSTSSSLQDQISIWLDRILDGTVDKKILKNWPTL